MGKTPALQERKAAARAGFFNPLITAGRPLLSHKILDGYAKGAKPALSTVAYVCNG
jgi:hypothetical protein